VLFSFFRYIYTQYFTVNAKSSSGLAIIYLSKLFVFFVLIVPLVLLAVILMVRVLILWVVIPFSPLIFGGYILGLVPGEYKSKI
jgi:hypothetical protein